jgi:hypothetical protein
MVQDGHIKVDKAREILRSLSAEDFAIATGTG